MSEQATPCNATTIVKVYILGNQSVMTYRNIILDFEMATGNNDVIPAKIKVIHFIWGYVGASSGTAGAASSSDHG